MLLIVILTYILAQCGVPLAATVWGWFVAHWIITILLVLFLA